MRAVLRPAIGVDGSPWPGSDVPVLACLAPPTKEEEASMGVGGMIRMRGIFGCVAGGGSLTSGTCSLTALPTGIDGGVDK